MADGYTRETGKLGVCCATTGPGATNLITGVASAYADEIPMLVITAQTQLNTFGKGAIQESSCTGVNTLGMFEYCTRYNSLVSHIEQLEGKLYAAIGAAFQSPGGPVHLSIPLDILRCSLPREGGAFRLDRLAAPQSLINKSEIAELHAAITNAKSIVFLIGLGCSEAMSAILDLARITKATLVTTPSGKGLVNPYHPQFKGVFGFAGHSSAYAALAHPDVDLVVAMGTSLGEFESMAWDEKAILNNRLIHIDSSLEHLSRSPMARLHVRGRILAVLEGLLEFYKTERQHGVYDWMAFRQRLRDKEAVADRRVAGSTGRPCIPVQLPHHFTVEEESKCLDDSTPIKPQRLMHELSRLFPLNARFIADTGNGCIWAIHYLHPLNRRMAGDSSVSGGLIRMAMGFCSMGWAIGGAVGTALGRPGVPVVCITGDGSFLMNGQEITVAVEEQLPVIFIVLNDAALGTVKHGQRMAKAEPIGYQLPPVNFAMMARAMGAEAYTIHSPQDLKGLDIEHLCKRRGPSLLDVHIDGEEVPPMNLRVMALNMIENSMKH
jgi:acetolactate synthase-1/2/3 large subunit